jgi:hypothetical protein
VFLGGDVFGQKGVVASKKLLKHFYIEYVTFAFTLYTYSTNYEKYNTNACRNFKINSRSIPPTAIIAHASLKTNSKVLV